MQPLLPKLKKGDKNKVSNFNDAGVWDVRQHIELDNLSESLDVEDIDSKYFDIDCIPDVWARPLLFEMALYDANHLLHGRILGEWRGLLAILALKEWRNLTMLRVMPVEIPQPDQPDLVETRSQTPLDFLSVLGLIPSKTLSNDTLWYNLYVILFGNEPIGITSPTTLVCTASDYYNHIKNVTWFNGRFLFDPTPKLGAHERKALASWLEQLKNNLDKHEGLNQEMREWNALLGLLNQFQEDLGGMPELLDALSNSSLGLTTGIFRHLDKPIKGKEVSLKESYILLKPSQKKPPWLSLLVVDRKIPEQWNMPDYEVFVWGSTMLAAFPFSGLGSNRTQFGSIQLPEDVQLRLPEDFFTEKLFVINQQSAFPGAMNPRGPDSLQHQGQPVTPIIPIKDELLNYLTVDDLYSRIWFEPSSEGIVVKLRLPLSGPDGKGEDFEIKREFRSHENEVILIPNVPVLEIWPNFRSTNWKVYYTYFSTANQMNTFYAKPYTPDDTPEIQTFENNRGEIVSQITRTSLFPEAIICTAQVPNTSTNTMRLVPAGLLLINQLQPLPLPTSSWAIGIDFGTTSTNVYANDYNQEPFPVQFEKRFLQVTESGAIRARLYDDFLPGETESTPFLSIFHNFQKTTKPSLRSLLDGHIYFLRGHKTFRATAQGMATDLKWSEDPADRIHTRAFLEQLCLQCAAEAAFSGAKKVNWRFSFPTAFSAKDREEFRQIWNQITKTCSQVTGLAQSSPIPVDEPESVVSARFFAEHPRVDKASFAIGAICIDIGGGTSDISIWQDNELRWQTSLRFAGRDMFLNLLYEKPDFLKIFQVDDKILESLKGIKGKKAFYAQADAIITYEGQEWLMNLPIHNAKAEVKEFVKLIAIGISGLFYYVGLLLQYLHKSSRYNAQQMPSVYIAGNGAKMFHWLAAGAYNSRSSINSLFKDVLLRASGFKSDPKWFEVKISPQPKSEAAFGLVCGGPLLKYNGSAKMDEVLAGEMFKENGNRCDWSETITAERIKRGVQAQQKLEKLEDFVQTFDNYAKSQNSVVSAVAVDAVLKNKIYQRLSQTLANLRGANEEIIHVEPLFIIALKTLLEIKTHEWSNP